MGCSPTASHLTPLSAFCFSDEKGRNTLKFQKYVYYVKKIRIHLPFTLAALFSVTVGKRELKY